MGDGRREEGRRSLSFSAWIAIAVGLVVVTVPGLHVPVCLRYRHEREIVAEARRQGDVVRAGGWVPLWPMSVLADRWEPPGSSSTERLLSTGRVRLPPTPLLSDMGGVYTLAVQPGTRIRGNLIHDIEKATYGGWAVYPDGGSSRLVIEDNVCYGTSSEPFHQHCGRENPVRNNVFAFGRGGLVRISRGGWHDAGYAHCGRNNLNSTTFIGNILIADGTPFFVARTGRESTIAGKDFRSDLNLFWDVTGHEPLSGDCASEDARRDSLEPPLSIDDWRKLGFDMHSLVADPKFRNPKSGGLTLADDSPAPGLGFRPIDLSDVGPRPRGKRTAE